LRIGRKADENSKVQSQIYGHSTMENKPMVINRIYEILKCYYVQIKVPQLDKTGVISELYPGQFNYCLDERHWFEKYGDIVNVDEDHFQKIQPAIRLADFETFYIRRQPSNHHLATFLMATINGGHVISADQGENYYRKAVAGLLNIFDQLGLKKSRLRVSYFAGGITGRDIEEERKTNGQMKKILADQVLPEHTLSKIVWQENGIPEKNLLPGDTWTNFLAINWYACVAPWGFRNEIFYILDDGAALDLATVEHLTYEPQTEGSGENRTIVDIRPWRNNIVIDGVGLERLVLATIGSGSIMEAMRWQDLLAEFSPAEIEALRILHQVFNDYDYANIKSRARRKKLRQLMALVNALSAQEIKKVLTHNAKTYQMILPDLNASIEKTIAEIVAYRQRRSLSE
jgi:hypothetical protein